MLPRKEKHVDCPKCGVISSSGHNEFTWCQACKTLFADDPEEQENEWSTSEHWHSDEEYRDVGSERSIPCPPLVGAFWGYNGKLVYFNSLTMFKFRGRTPELRTYAQCQELFDYTLNGNDPFVGPADLGLVSPSSSKRAGMNPSKSQSEDDDYSFNSDFLTYFNPRSSLKGPIIDKSSTLSIVERPPSSDLYEDSVSSEKCSENGISNTMERAYTVIIQNYSKLFSFNKAYAINAKIKPPCKACLHNAKLATVLAMSPSIARAWILSETICDGKHLKRPRTNGIGMVDPTRTLAMHLLLRFMKVQDNQMVSLLWAVFYHAGLDLHELKHWRLDDSKAFKSNILKQGASAEVEWIQRIHDCIEGYADNLFQIGAFVQRMWLLKCTPSSILLQRARAEDRMRRSVIVEVIPPAAMQKSQKSKPKTHVHLVSNSNVKTPWDKGSLYSFGRDPRSACSFDICPETFNSEGVLSFERAWIETPDNLKVKLTKSQSHPEVSNLCSKPQHDTSPERRDVFEKLSGVTNTASSCSRKRRFTRKMSDNDNIKFKVRNFLPKWSSRVRVNDANSRLPAQAPAAKPLSQQSTPADESDSRGISCYVCGLTVRGLWVVCSFCGNGGHMEHILSPDLKIGHFCTINRLPLV